MNVYIVCPVRNVKQKQADIIDRHVRLLEDMGHTVHYPPRDVDQSDPVGTSVCLAHRDAMEHADRVDVYYDPTSSGSLFDLGMAWILHKPIRIINAISPTKHKSFANVLLAWEAAE